MCLISEGLLLRSGPNANRVLYYPFRPMAPSPHLRPAIVHPRPAIRRPWYAPAFVPVRRVFFPTTVGIGAIPVAGLVFFIFLPSVLSLCIFGGTLLVCAVAGVSAYLYDRRQESQKVEDCQQKINKHGVLSNSKSQGAVQSSEEGLNAQTSP